MTPEDVYTPILGNMAPHMAKRPLRWEISCVTYMETKLKGVGLSQWGALEFGRLKKTRHPEDD